MANFLHFLKQPRGQILPDGSNGGDPGLLAELEQGPMSCVPHIPLRATQAVGLALKDIYVEVEEDRQSCKTYCRDRGGL